MLEDVVYVTQGGHDEEVTNEPYVFSIAQLERCHFRTGQ